MFLFKNLASGKQNLIFLNLKNLTEENKLESKLILETGSLPVKTSFYLPTNENAEILKSPYEL